jgi:predicted regulator of Ras-like GTPase activity (Roadblock/LC7/MglB family)
MAQKSAQAYAGEDNIAALASGSFYATRVLAELLGEAEFRHAIHQGSHTSMYMQIMDCDLLVLVVFGQESNPGLVKLYCAESCHAIDDMFGHQPFNTTAMPQTGTVFELDASRNPFQRVG